MPALTKEQIEGLLKTEKTRAPRKAAQSQKLSPHERPIQLGPLRYVEKDDKCANRGCSTPCHIRIKGVPYCTTHALYSLNELYMMLDGTYEKYNIGDCVCNAGRHSKHNTHTADCPVFKAYKEQDDSTSASSGTSTT